MRLSVTYEESDVAKALEKIISDPNKGEFVKLLTPLICGTSAGIEHFFKLMIGNELPKVIPNGTLCKLPVDELGYGCNKELIRAKFADSEDKVVVTVKEFRGYHEYSQYHVEYQDVLADGSLKKDSTYISSNKLEIIEEL